MNIKTVIVGCLLIFFSGSCKSPAPSFTEVFPFTSITISSSDLSEDSSIFSSKDDEILFFLFRKQGDDWVNSEQEYFTLTPDTMTHTFLLSPSIELNTELLLAIVEVDTEPQPSIRSKAIQDHTSTLLEASRKHDLLTIEQYLNDDDLLGITVWQATPKPIIFTGTGRLDRYNYRIVFE